MFSYDLINQMQFKYNLTAVGLRYDFPYVNLGRGCISMDCIYPGAEVEFLRYCLQMINATATIVPRDMRTDEMIDMLGNGTADITLFPLVQRRERMEKVEFATPIGLLYIGYYVLETDRLEAADLILTAFRFPALSMLILSNILVGILLYYYTKVFDSCRWSPLNFMVTACCGLLKQYHLNLNGPICASILVCAWLWFSFAVVVHYETKLRALLTSTRYRGSLFTNLDEAMDLMENYGWKMLVQKESYSPFHHCHPAQCERLKKLQKRLMIKEHNGSDLPSKVTKDHFAFSALPKDIAPHQKSLIDEGKRMLFVRDDFITPMYLAYTIRKGIPHLLEDLNRAIALMSNSFETIRGRYKNPFREYIDKQFIDRQTPLSLAHFEFLLWLTFRCILVALLFLLGGANDAYSEILHFRLDNRLRSYLRGLCLKFLQRKSSSREQTKVDLELTEHNGATKGRENVRDKIYRKINKLQILSRSGFSLITDRKSCLSGIDQISSTALVIYLYDKVMYLFETTLL